MWKMFTLGPVHISINVKKHTCNDDNDIGRRKPQTNTSCFQNVNFLSR